MSEIVKETAEYVEMSDSITLSIVKDGTAATVYTIEPCANFEATGRLTDDASKIEVSIVGDVLVYKKTGSEPKEIYDVVSPYWFVLSVGDKNYAGYKEPFNSYENSARIAISKTLDYPISTETNNIPGSATLTVYDGKVSVSNDNTVSTTANQLASLVVPISLNAGAIQKIDTKLGNITETTTSIQGEITQIKQGQGEINLKVQGLGRDGVNMIYGGDVLGLADNKKYSAFQSNQIELKANVTYTVSARMWMNASSSHNMLLVVFDDTWKVLDAFKSFSNTSAQVDGFSFTPNVDVKARVGIYEQYGKGGDPKSYVGVYIDWVRLEKGNLKDDDLKIDSLPTKWTPSLADIEANNLIPDPDFENSTWEMSENGATRELINNQNTGTDFMSQYSGDQGTYGIYGLRMKRSGYSGTDNIYDGMQYYIPFQGAGDYTLSVFFKNLGNAALDREAVVEIHPCGADKTRTRGGTRVAINKSNPAIGYVLGNVTRTFPEYETRSSDGKSVKTEWIEVRIFLTKNGDVVVSRLSLAKCSHAIHWNTAALRSTNAVYSVADNLLATGIDIANRKILITSDNVKVRNNKGEETTAVDAQGNLTARSLTCQDDVSGTVMNIKNGFFSALKGKAGVSLGVDKNGYPCLVGTDPNGNVLWRLGQKYETADQDSKVTMEVVSMKAYGQMNSYAIGEGVILTLNVTNNTNAAITINTSNMHMSLKSEFGNYRGNVDVARNIAVGATVQVVLRGTEAIDISSSSSTYTSPVGRSVTAVVIYQGDMRLMQDAEYQELEGLRKDSDGNVQYTLPLMWA